MNERLKKPVKTTLEIDLGTDGNEVVLDGIAAVVFLDPLSFDVDRDYLFAFKGIAILNDVLDFDGEFDFVFMQAFPKNGNVTWRFSDV